MAFGALNNIRRGDQTDTGCRVTGATDGLRDLVARKLTTFSRFCTLSHLDLKLIRVGKIVGCDAKTTRSNLLDGGAKGVAVGKRNGALSVFTTFTSIGLSTKTVHSDGESGM